MSNLLSYKNYNGTVEYSKEGRCLFGRVVGVKSLLSYEGDSVKELEQDFQNVIDEHLADCKERNVEPEQPCKGTFNISNKAEDSVMIGIAVVGCTGKLGINIVKAALNRKDMELRYAIARKGNQFVGHKISELVGGKNDLPITDDITSAKDCDVFIDCTNAETFMNDSYPRYEKMGKALVIATTGFSAEALEKIGGLAAQIPVFMAGNFSLTLYHFIETVKFYAKSISPDTDIQIVEYHHNQKKDAPSGTALMIKEALLSANDKTGGGLVNISSVRGGNIFGEHVVIFANAKGEVVELKHQVSSREAFADGAIEISTWLAERPNGMYHMDDFSNGMS